MFLIIFFISKFFRVRSKNSNNDFRFIFFEIKFLSNSGQLTSTNKKSIIFSQTYYSFLIFKVLVFIFLTVVTFAFDIQMFFIRYMLILNDKNKDLFLLQYRNTHINVVIRSIILNN